MSHLCPSCQRPVYSSSLTHCGYCGAKLPDGLFSESYLDDTFTPESAVADALSHFERVLQMLRDSERGCAGWVEELERRRSELYSKDAAVQKQAIIALRGRCHHQALGDALTIDRESYLGQLEKLWRACDRVIRIYETHAA
jgi:hypothetical protein